MQRQCKMYELPYESNIIGMVHMINMFTSIAHMVIGKYKNPSKYFETTPLPFVYHGNRRQIPKLFFDNPKKCLTVPKRCLTILKQMPDNHPADLYSSVQLIVKQFIWDLRNNSRKYDC